MKRGVMYAGAFSAILTASVFACDKHQAKSNAEGTPVQLASDTNVEATVQSVLASLPHIEYRIGDKTTTCGYSAEEMAASASKPIQFVIGDATFDSKGEAMVKLTSLLEKEIDGLKSMQYVAGGSCGGCPMTAKRNAEKSGTKVMYRVAGVDFKDKATAQAVLAKLPAVVESVSMEYKVDGKKYGCSKTAGAKCKEAGKEMTYVIGSQETQCQMTAKMMLMETLVRKLVETAIQAQTKA